MTLSPIGSAHRIMRSGIFLLAISLSQICNGCASRDPYIPFSIPREESHRDAQTIALVPVLGPEGIDVSESLLVEIDSLIEETLTGAGYNCIPGIEHTAAWGRIVAQMGGLYDSTTGDLDELRLEVAKEQLRHDLVDLYQPDYMLFPEIWVVQVASSSGVARWDGASQPVVGFGLRLLNAIDATLHQYEGFLQPELVDALSLGVIVENMDGVEIFQHAGGIEVLKTNDETHTFEPILTDPERTLRAVRTALSPFLEGRGVGQ